jgi:hypothetical protein
VSAELERRYRDALRWYPRKWLRRNEDVVVGTLLDVADADDRTTPAKGELAGLRRTAIAAHFGVFARILPSEVRDRAASISLGFGASLSLAAILVNVLVPERIIASWPAVRLNMFGPFGSSAVLLYGLWVLAFVVAVVGFGLAARVLIALSLPLSVIVRLIGDAGHQFMSPSGTTLGLLGLSALIVVVGRPADSRRRQGTTAGVFIAATLLSGVASAFNHGGPFISNFGLYSRDPFLQPVSMWLIFVGPLAALVALALRHSHRAWAGAIVLSLVPMAVSFTLFGQQGYQLYSRLFFSGSIAIVCAVIYLTLRLFGLRIRITRG